MKSKLVPTEGEMLKVKQRHFDGPLRYRSLPLGEAHFLKRLFVLLTWPETFQFSLTCFVALQDDAFAVVERRWKSWTAFAIICLFVIFIYFHMPSSISFICFHVSMSSLCLERLYSDLDRYFELWGKPTKLLDVSWHHQVA